MTHLVIFKMASSKAGHKGKNINERVLLIVVRVISPAPLCITRLMATPLSPVSLIRGAGKRWWNSPFFQESV